MKHCPQCNYLLDGLEFICPRCQGKGIKSPATASNAATPSKMERIRKEALETRSTSESVGGSLRGGLLALLPAFLITMSFAFDMAVNGSARDQHTGLFSITFFICALFFVPLCCLCGAGVGGWIGSSFPVQRTKEVARIGAGIAAAICVLLTVVMYSRLEAVLFVLFPLIFVTVVVAGAYGGAERQRNGHGDNDGELIAHLGIGFLSLCLPLIGLLLIISLNRSGSDKAPAALWGTIIGVVFTFLLVLPALLTRH